MFRRRLAAFGAATLMLGVSVQALPSAEAARQPYGGCKEAYTAPHSAGARWCVGRTFRHFTRWQRVSQQLGDALSEGGSRGATTRDWERCVVRYGRTTVVVCPDGHVEVS